MFLIVGLGNPGAEHADHRHNIGFLVADKLVERLGVSPLKSKFGGELGRGEMNGKAIAILKPMEYMNLSGPVVQRTAAFFQVEPGDVVVIHDDIDLEFGRVKVKRGGGHGGHNGLRSIAEHFAADHLRVRCGVGHPGHKERVVGHVLGAFSTIERPVLGEFVGRAADAVESVVREGAAQAMNRFNSGKE